MSDEISIAQPMSIREAGHDEYWLQNQIWANPAALGLGDLDPLFKERRQTSGGRVDILLKDPQHDSMYEVEVMLGETDETHIIRTIEYWDVEKRRWPQRQHYAVLVAESITRRFFNVIHILSHSVPIIAVQVSLVEVAGRKALHFTKVLDTFEEIDDGSSLQDLVLSYVSISVGRNNYFRRTSAAEISRCVDFELLRIWPVRLYTALVRDDALIVPLRHHRERRRTLALSQY